MRTQPTKRWWIIKFVAAIVVSGHILYPAQANEAKIREWNFQVFLDDKEIGYHNFQLAQSDGRSKLTVEADFKVKFLLFTAYQYEHSNAEIWQGGCLREINSTTNANGKKFAVSGAQETSGFNIEGDGNPQSLGDCIKTFAYWNPAILDEAELLNSQTGELLPIEVEPVGDDTLRVQGETLAATRYHLSAKNVDIDLWYSRDQRWLGLESTIRGGRKLRYQLVGGSS